MGKQTSAKFLFYLLNDLAGEDGAITAPMCDFERLTGYTRMTVVKGFDKLIKDGLITIEHRKTINGADLANTYTILNFTKEGVIENES
jgi:hypothetical protein